jgi:dihydrolipoamide dehydrogenase
LKREEMAKVRTDLVVVGGGAAGVAAAVRARQLGARVALIEAERLGGVCMNKGCIPTKCLMETARLYWRIKRAGQLGLVVPNVELDWNQIMARKEDLVGYLRMGTEGVLKSNGVEILKGAARFETPHRIKVGNELLEGERFLLATGSTWAELGISGDASPGVVTTDWLLDMRQVPQEVLVLGGGPVELEAAQYLSFLGAKVTILEPQARLLPGEDREMSRRLSAVLKEQGLTLVTRVKPLEIRETERGVGLLVQTPDGEKNLEASLILHAARVPALAELHLERAGVNLLEGLLQVDANLRTNQSHILAAGDVTGPPFYSHRASAMAILAAENSLGSQQVFEQARVPRAFFTYPEMACVGLTEAQAKERGHKVRSATIPYSVNARAMMALETDGAVKIVSDARYGEILGVHIVGPHATELISEGALAMELEATVEELARGIRLHPSISESQVEAARECLGRGIYVLR